MRMTASTWEKIIAAERNAVDMPFGGHAKYKRWFWMTETGDIWLMDVEFYDSKYYSSATNHAICVVYATAMFPKFDKVTGDLIPDSISFEWSGSVKKSELKKYHAEKVEIIPDHEGV